MKVGIVVLNYHGAANTQRCLESLGRLDPKGCRVQVIVVDNSETGHDFEFFKRQYKEAEFLHDATPRPLQKSLTFIKAPANRGYSGGNNIGLRFLLKSGCDYLWVLNNDTKVEPDALGHLLQKMEQSGEKIGFLGTKMLYEDGTLQGIGGRYYPFIAQSRAVGAREQDKGQYDRDDIRSLVDFPIGASIFFRRHILEEVGLLNETYFLYFEEMDYVLRAKNMGYDFDICYRAKVWHIEGASCCDERGRIERADKANLKNRLLFTKRYFPCHYPFVYLSLFAALFTRIARKKWSVAKYVCRLLAGRAA